METIIKKINWKHALFPIALLMGFAIFTGLGALGIGELGYFMNSFLSGIDIFAFWCVFLTAVGIGILYYKSTKTSLTVITGLWIFGLLFLSGFGSVMFGIIG